MNSHPSIALNVEMRAFEERMGISRRGPSVGSRSQSITLGQYLAKLQQTIVQFATSWKPQVSGQQTNVPSTLAS